MNNKSVNNIIIINSNSTNGSSYCVPNVDFWGNANAVRENKRRPQIYPQRGRNDILDRPCQS